MAANHNVSSAVTSEVLWMNALFHENGEHPLTRINPGYFAKGERYDKILDPGNCT